MLAVCARGARIPRRPAPQRCALALPGRALEARGRGGGSARGHHGRVARLLRALSRVRARVCARSVPALAARARNQDNLAPVVAIP